MTEVTLAPREANLLITGRCNLRCGHCGVRSPDTDLSLFRWDAILDRLVDARVLTVTLSGGEPLCRRDFAEFIPMLLGKPLRFSLNTNATLLSPGTACILANAGPRLASIMAGLDGPDSATHDALRGPGTFRRAVRGIRNALAAGLPVTVNCTVTRINWNRIPDCARFMVEELGAGQVKFTPLLAAQCPIPESLQASTSMLLSAGRELDALARNGMPVYGPLLEIYAMASRAVAGTLPRGRGRAFSCGGCKTKMTVNSRGEVTPCDYLDGFVLGTLPEQTLNGIMASKKTKAFVRLLKQPRSGNPECARCAYLPFCTGGCPVHPLLIGDPLAKDVLSCVKNLAETLKSLP